MVQELRDFGVPSRGPGDFHWHVVRYPNYPMAAVFALVFLPVIAAVGFMARSDSTLDARTAMALAVFIPMAFGVFYGALRMAKRWEEQTD